MAYVKVKRRPLTFWQRTYLPVIASGMGTTIGHMGRALFGKGNVTMEYPEEKHTLPGGYRGAPVLVKDQEGREKCVSCSLCEYVCPPRAISIVPGEISGPVEKGPQVFDIDMLRCIFCGYCEEVCPEQAIFMSEEYEICGSSRGEMVRHKDELYRRGEEFGRDGRVADAPRKYEKLVADAAAQGLDLSK